MKTLSKPLFLIVILGALAFPGLSGAQQAVGKWTFHLNYTTNTKITGSLEGSLFASGTNSLYFYAASEQQVQELTRLDGLSSQDLEAVYFDPISRQLLVAHHAGFLDFVSESEVRTYFGLSENEFVANKKIHAFSAQDDWIWAAGTFGFVEVDAERRTFKESYTNLGNDGSPLGVFAVARTQEYTFIASSDGLRFASNSSNIKDFRSWQSIPGTEGTCWTQVLIRAEGQFAQNEEGEIYSFDTERIDQLFGISASSNLKSVAGQVYFQQDHGVFSLDQAGNYSQIFEWEQGFLDFWVNPNGVSLLLEETGILLPGESSPLKVPGPKSPSFGLGKLDDNVVSLATTYNSDREVLSSKSARSSILNAGTWTEADGPDSVTAMARWREDIYYGSSSGLWKKPSTGGITRVDLPETADDLPVSSLHADAQGNLWVGIFDQQNRLFQLSETGIQAVSVPGLLLPQDIHSDQQGKLWIVQGTRFGRTLRLFLPSTGESRSFGTTATQGNLPDEQVNSILLDQQDRLWLATEKGIAFFPSASSIESATRVEAIRPFVNGAPALAGEPVLSIVQSPDQSFFAGTEKSGLWHFAPSFDQLLATYTPENSPLPDREILELLVDGAQGYLFVRCPQGILSLRTGIKHPFGELETLKIFPNPVNPDFLGLLTIEGLVPNADLLITDTSGRPVYRARTQGGSITWDLLDSRGQRLSTGVYLVYVYDESGQQRAQGKFLVI